MELEISDVDTFKKVMETIGSLMSDVSLDLFDSGMAVKAMSPDNVAMVILDAQKKFFSAYNVDKETKLSISLDDMNGVLRFVRKEDKLHFTDSKGKLLINVKGKNKIKFSLPLIDENYTAQRVPQLKFTAEITMLSSVLKDAIKRALTVDDSIYFTIDGPRLVLSAKSEEKEFSEELSLNDDKELFSVKSEGITRAKYSLEHLNKFVTPLDPDKPLTIKLSNNYPLSMRYELNDSAAMSFILANRIE